MSPSEDELCQMGVCFHGAAESLLANEGKCVGVVDDNPAESIWLGMGPFTEVVDLVSDCMDSTVFFATEPEDGIDLEGGLLANHCHYVFQES